MRYYYNNTTGQLTVKMPTNGISMRKGPYIDTEQNINEFEADLWHVNLETTQLELKD